MIFPAMTPRQLIPVLQATLLTPELADLDCIRTAYASDLMSDVLEHAPAGAILITLQNRAVAAGVAFEKHLPAILVCHARTPEPNLLVHCQREKIALLSTPLDQFSASFRIGQCLLA